MARNISVVTLMALIAGAPALAADAIPELPVGSAPTSVTVTPADPPATPAGATTPGMGALVIPAAILVGIAAAVAGGGGNSPAAITGTTGTQ